MRQEKGPTAGAETPTPKDKPGRKSKVFWRAEDYLKLADALHTMKPSLNFIHSTTLDNLSGSDIREAMAMALPPHRHRAIISVAPFRPGLLDAFAELREIYASRASAKAIEAAQEAVTRAREAERRNTPQVNEYEAAFKPLVDMLTRIVAGQIGAMEARLIAQFSTEAPRVIDAQASSVQLPAAPVLKLQRPPKPRVGVFGPLPIQAEALATAFPELEILSVHNEAANKAVSTFRSASRVIGMTSFMNHSADSVLAKAFGSKYARVTGGVSAIKRQIEIWMKSGVMQ